MWQRQWWDYLVSYGPIQVRWSSIWWWSGSQFYVWSWSVWDVRLSSSSALGLLLRLRCGAVKQDRLYHLIMRERRAWLRAVVLFPVALALTSCENIVDSSTKIVVRVPSVLGLGLDEAKSSLKNVSSDFSLLVRDALASRRVFRESNWIVVDQTPNPGAMVDVGSRICLRVVKKNEKVNSAPAEPMPECGSASNSVSKSSVGSSTTVPVASSPISKEDALENLIGSLSAQGRFAASDSRCGSFMFLVSLDGSYHFYEWYDNKWISRANYLGQLFPKMMKSVRAIDTTEDQVADFVVTLPTWDPFSKSKPVSGAIFASVDCKWQWLTFKTTTNEDWYQLDFLAWDAMQDRVIAGDEVTDMFGPDYTGERKTELRYFRFQKSTGDFRLTRDKPEETLSQSSTSPATRDPFAALPAAVRDAVKASCNWPAADLAAAYGVSSKSKKRIAEAVAADFQEQYQELVASLCLQYIR